MEHPCPVLEKDKLIFLIHWKKNEFCHSFARPKDSTTVFPKLKHHESYDFEIRLKMGCGRKLTWEYGFGVVGVELRL